MKGSSKRDDAGDSGRNLATRESSRTMHIIESIVHTQLMLYSNIPCTTHFTLSDLERYAETTITRTIRSQNTQAHDGHNNREEAAL